MTERRRQPAKWRNELTDKERDELRLAESIRDGAAENLRNLTKKLKDRCIKRLIRRKERDE